MIAKWLWLSLPILALALPEVRPQARTEEDCEEPEWPGNYGASPSHNEYNNEYPGPEFPGPYHGKPSAHEGPEYDPSYEFGGPGNGGHGYDPDNRGPWEGGNYDDKNSEPYNNNNNNNYYYNNENSGSYNNYNNENSDPYNNYDGNHGEHYNNNGNPDPFFESPDYFPNDSPPYPYTSTLGQTITLGPTTITVTPTATATPAMTSFLLRSQGSLDVPDGNTLSDVPQGDGSGLAIFNNGNGIFTLNANGNLVDMATNLVAGIGPANTNDVLPVQFNLAEQFAAQDGTVCVCSAQSILSCDCGQGFLYFQTDATGELFIGQGSAVVDEGYNPVTVVVDYTIDIITSPTCC